MTKEKEKHAIKKIALAWVLCECGWQHRIVDLKGKKDEDLSLECLGQFDKHHKKFS